MPDRCHSLTRTLGSDGAVVRVLPDVTGLDKQFDYLVPDELADDLTVGSIVRVPLHGRRVRGWVTAVDPSSEVDAGTPAAGRQVLVDRSRCRADRPCRVGIGALGGRTAATVSRRRQPTDERHGACRRRSAAEPSRPPSTVARRAAELLDRRRGACWSLPPAISPLDAIVVAAAHGRTLVAMPTVGRAEAMAAALTRRGLRVAVVPRQWALAAAGVDVVIGARGAAWAPCPELGVAVVIDEHDETLQEERNPTWHARDVIIERARRAGAPVLLTSPCPTVAGVDAVGGSLARLRGRRGTGRLADRRDRRPQRRGAVAHVAAVVGADRRLRDRNRRVVCVHNTTGRARILACRTCRALLRCTRCEAAVGLDDDGRLVCPRCGASARRCARSAADRVSPTCGPASPVSARSSRRRPGARLPPSPAADSGPAAGRRCVRRDRGGAPSGRGRRCRRLLRLRSRAAGAALPRRRAGDGAAHQGGPAARTATARRTVDGPDVPAPSRGHPGCPARRPRPAARRRTSAP